MFFAETQRETYERNPLREVICQLRFPTILRVTTEPPAAFQDSIRDSYPLFAGESVAAGLPKEINEILSGLTGSSLAQGMQQTQVYKFETEDRLRFISLAQDFLALTEKKYVRWEQFQREMKRAEDNFRQLYKPSFYERVGLRYQNVIDREVLGLADRPWTDLLNSSLLGLLGVTDSSQPITDIRTHAMIKLPKGVVRIRHGLVLANGKKHLYIIDSDFFVEERSEPNHAFEILAEFNRLAARFFRWAITDTLRQALRPNPIE